MPLRRRFFGAARRLPLLRLTGAAGGCTRMTESPPFVWCVDIPVLRRAMRLAPFPVCAGQTWAYPSSLRVTRLPGGEQCSHSPYESAVQGGRPERRGPPSLARVPMPFELAAVGQPDRRQRREPAPAR